MLLKQKLMVIFRLLHLLCLLVGELRGYQSWRELFSRGISLVSDVRGFEKIQQFSAVSAFFWTIFCCKSVGSLNINFNNEIITNYYFKVMIDKIKEILQSPKEFLTAASGLTLLALYYFYGRKELGLKVINPEAKSGLDMHLTELTNQPKREDIIKIAITESTKTKSELRSKIISTVKSQMIKNNIVTLVNCSPLKLLNSGCECFLAGIDYKDPDDEEEIISYLQNAIKCQLVIEKTIVDIESIKKQNRNVFILCDTNSMDTKVGIEQHIWDNFLKQNTVDENNIKRNYDIVFHVKDLVGRDEIVDMENQMITENWKGHKNYYTINYDKDLTFEENIHEGVKKVKTMLLPFLPHGFEWKKN